MDRRSISSVFKLRSTKERCKLHSLALGMGPTRLWARNTGRWGNRRQHCGVVWEGGGLSRRNAQEKHQLITYKVTKQEEKADQYVSGDWESRSTQFIREMAENLTSQRVTREEFFVPIGETWVAQFFNDTTTSGPKCCMQLKQLESKMLPKTSPSFQWWIALYYSRT